MTASAGAWYRVGKVNVTNGVKTISGAGSKWLNDLVAIAVGDAFTVDAKTWYEVIAVNSDTSIVLDRGYEGGSAAGVNYAILRSTSGTILTRIAGQISVQFNQKQLFLDELRNWLTSTDSSVSLTDSHGNTYQYKSLSNIQALTGTVVSRDVGTSAGNVMEVGAFGLGGSGSAVISDFDQIPTNSVGATMFVKSAFQPSNRPPDGSNWYAGVFRTIFTNHHVYEVRSATTSDKAFTWRRYYYAGSWREWVLEYDSENIVGTVSQSEGIPTGAIIERGSNANGEYVKFADGTVSFWATTEVPPTQISDQVGSLFYSEQFLIPYPISTISTPSVTTNWSGPSGLDGRVFISRGLPLSSGMAIILSQGLSRTTSAGGKVTLTGNGRWF